MALKNGKRWPRFRSFLYLFALLPALMNAGCGCGDTEWTVNLVCTTGQGPGSDLEPQSICVPCGQGEGKACTEQQAVAIALGQIGGCTQDGPAILPFECPECP